MALFVVRMLKNQYIQLDVPDDVELQSGEFVLVLTEKGEEIVPAYTLCESLCKQWLHQSNRKNDKKQKETKNPDVSFIRKCTQDDMKAYEQIKKEELKAVAQCKELIQKHKLAMNLVCCRYTFDKKKISFYYTAPERVDFRALLKDLTQVFKRVRIDLRHIGVRDETSMLGGCGLCGRPFCCASHLRNFNSINIKLARDQGMPITPGKISGSCGRLLCCLNYEYSNYLNAAKDLPPIGSGVMTPCGVGKVCALHFLNKKLSIKLEDGQVKEFSKDQIEMIDGDVNIVIDDYFNYAEPDEHIDLKSLEDDRNSSTGQI